MDHCVEDAEPVSLTGQGPLANRTPITAAERIASGARTALPGFI